MEMDFLSGAFLAALFKIIWIDILLSGDNALVIAMASRNLPPKQQKSAIFIGTAGAILLRVVLTVFAVSLLQYPYLKLVGAALLLWIAVKLLSAGDEDTHITASDSLWAAIRTILIADFAMSLDNVIAVAAAAKTAPENMHLLLLFFGLGLSIPLIIFSSTMLLKLMQRFPSIVVLGAALLGFVAGEMAVTDLAIHDWFEHHMHGMGYAVSITLAIVVVVIGKWLAARSQSSTAPNA